MPIALATCLLRREAVAPTIAYLDFL